jgi:ThiF family
MKRPIPELDSSRCALFRITEEDQRRLEKLVFHRHPEREWGTFFRFGYRETSWGAALSFVELIPPQPGDLDRNSPIVSFRPDYIARALDAIEHQPFGVGVVHSHPQGWGASPSPSDDDMDAYYLRLFEPYGKGRPYVSLIVNRNEDGRFVFSGRAFDRGVWIPVTEWFALGGVLKRYRSLLQRNPPVASETSQGDSVIARWELLIGPEVRDRFAAASIGVIGYSGTGSPAIEALARAQVGEFVLVDEQRLGLSNIERMHGSRLADIRNETPPFKVEVMARLIREVNAKANISMFVGNVLDDKVLDALLRCDLILGCTDTLHARAQMA